MRMYRIPGKKGIKSALTVTLYPKGEAPLGRLSVNSPTSEKEYWRRVRKAMKLPTLQKGGWR